MLDIKLLYLTIIYKFIKIIINLPEHAFGI